MSDLIPRPKDIFENIPYLNIIGGPFKSVVDAQFQVALTCIDFIRRFGFEDQDDDAKTGTLKSGEVPVRAVQIKYEKPHKNPLFGNVHSRVSVPLLTMVEIPILRIETFSIKLQVHIWGQQDSSILQQGSMFKIHTASSGGEDSEDTKGTSTSFGRNKANDGYELVQETLEQTDTWSNTAQLTGFVATTAYNNQGHKVSEDYSMRVEILATEDAMPGGLERLMDIMTQLIKKPAKTAVDKTIEGFIAGSINGENAAGAGAGGASGGAAAAVP
eukprot:CAMPEP_0177657436 /NCGR_PEP_ID=MMETSP0447-20121125/16183_1 /TAXON_ID=0 /ORGANISM="Stygamoeba regulata, Strain BSH-02190019" /LENGTH=271 /DNA_ID=CAMNT_0019161789 /DNA_START=178 /DNA_END=989 /DNA_ORIENTATION=+